MSLDWYIVRVADLYFGVREELSRLVFGLFTEQTKQIFTSALTAALLAPVILVSFVGTCWAEGYPTEIVIQLGHQGRVDSIAFSPNGRTVVTSSGGNLLIWDFETGREVRFISAEPLSDLNLRARYAAVLPDNLTAVVLDSDKTMKFIDLRTGKKLREIKVGAWRNFALSRDGKLAEMEGKIFDLSDGSILRDFVKNVYSPPTSVLSPDGRLILLSSEAATEMVEVSTSKLLYKVASVRGVKLAAFSPDSRTLAVVSKGNDNLVRFVDVSSGQEVRQLDIAKSEIQAVWFSPDGSSLLVRSGTREMSLWSLDSGRLARTFVHDNNIEECVFSPDGAHVLVGRSDGAVIVWNLLTGSQRKLSGAAWRVSSYAPAGGGPLRASPWSQVEAVRHFQGEASEISFADGERLTITREGFFDSSSRGAAYNLNIVRGLKVYSIDQVYQALYRPDLVREKLAGDPRGLVREAAGKLDLSKVMASGDAPKVSIVTSAGNVSNDEVTVEASIAEQNGGGIGRIEWRVNGLTLGVESRGLERLPEGGGSSSPTPRAPVVAKRTLSLEPGENRIEVVAYNGRGLIASDPAQIVLKWDGEKSTTLPKLHVLAVGVNEYYDSRLRLSYAVPDARALGDALKRAGSALYRSVEVTSVLDDKVTADNLDQVFTDLGKKVQPRDVFVFFLAGHGKTVDGRYHFLPQNFRYEDETSILKRGIDQERFQAWFAKIPARKSILLYDTCESGSLAGDRAQQRGIERVAALEKMTRAMGRTVLSASSDDAPALEGYRGHGVFTYALLDGFQEADTNGNGLIEVTELAAFIDQKVPDLSYQAFKMRQIPQMKIVGNSFPVVSKTMVLAAPDGQLGAAAPVATKPTHVVVSSSPVDVYVAAARSGAVVQKIPPGTLVTLVETTAGWLLIARDGQKLGYVEERALLRLQ